MVMYNATKPITGQSTQLANQLIPSLAYNSKNNQLNTVAALTGSPAGTSTVNGYTPTVSTTAIIPSTTGAYSSVNYNPTTTTTSSTGGHEMMSTGTSKTTPVNVNQATVGSSDVYAAELKQLKDELASIKARNAMADTYNQGLLNYNTDALEFYKNILSGNAPGGIYGDIVKGYSDTEAQQRMKELINPLREQMALTGLIDSDAMNRSVAEAAANTMLESNQQKQSGLQYALSLLSQAPSEYYNPAQPLTAQTFSDLQNYLDYDLAKQSEAFQESQALRAYNDAQKEKEEAKIQAGINEMKARAAAKASSGSSNSASKWISNFEEMQNYLEKTLPYGLFDRSGTARSRATSFANSLLNSESGSSSGGNGGTGIYGGSPPTESEQILKKQEFEAKKIEDAKRQEINETVYYGGSRGSKNLKTGKITPATTLKYITAKQNGWA